MTNGESRVAPTATMDRPGSWPMSDDPRVVAALESYVNEWQGGRKPSRREFLENHPDIAGALGACLDGLDFLRSAARGLSSPDRVLGMREAIPPATCLGDYRIIREVGRGGMGVVYEAEQISLARRVALKVLPFAAAIDPKQKQRFHVEAQAAAHLHHPHIVPIFAVGNDGGSHFYAMPFIEGRTLAAMIQELRRFGGMSRGDAFLASRIAPSAESAPTADAVENAASLTSCEPSPTSKLMVSSASSSSHKGRAYYRAIARLGVEAAEALEHAHSLGVLHRDVKPANLIIDQKGKLWVTDFGLARFRDDPGPTRTGDLLGTLRYMSPEQLKARRGVVDQRADVYALGTTLYEALTLRPAFTGRDRQEIIGRILSDEPTRPRKIDPAIPRDLETILIKAMAKDPAARYATAQEFADDLRRFLDDQAILACPPPPWEHVRRWVRKHKTMVTTAATVMFAATTVCSILVVSEQRKTSAALTATTLKMNEAEEKYALALQGMEALVVASETQTMQAVRKVNEYGLAFGQEKDRPVFESALGFYEQLERTLKDDPNPKRRALLAKAYFGLGITKMMLLRPTAEEDYRAAERIYRGLLAEPDKLDMFQHLYLLRNLSGTLSYLAMHYNGSTPRNNRKAAEAQGHAVAVDRQALANTLPGCPFEIEFTTLLINDLMSLARYQQDCDRAEDAEQVYDEVLKRIADLERITGKTSNRGLVWNNMAWLFAVNKDRPPYDPERAVKLARQAVKVMPNEATYHNTLGMALFRSGDLDGAIKALNKSISLSGGDTHDWLLLAMIYQNKGDEEQAKPYYDRAVKKRKENRVLMDNPELAQLQDETAEVLGIKSRVKRKKPKLPTMAPAVPAKPSRPVAEDDSQHVPTPRAFVRQPAVPTQQVATPD